MQRFIPGVVGAGAAKVTSASLGPLIDRPHFDMSSDEVREAVASIPALPVLQKAAQLCEDVYQFDKVAACCQKALRKAEHPLLRLATPNEEADYVQRTVLARAWTKHRGEYNFWPVGLVIDGAHEGCGRSALLRNSAIITGALFPEAITFFVDASRSRLTAGDPRSSYRTNYEGFEETDRWMCDAARKKKTII